MKIMKVAKILRLTGESFTLKDKYGSTVLTVTMEIKEQDVVAVVTVREDIPMTM